MLNFFRTFWLISDFFWKTKKGLITLFIIGVLLLLSLVSVGLSVYMNSWNVGFYNSIQNYDKPLLVHQLIIFVVIIFLMMSNFFVSYLVGEFLVIYIRKPMTDFYTQKWLYTKCYLKSNSNSFDNPEERLDNDIENFIRISKSLFLGIISNLCSFVSFAIVLWGLSGDYHFEIGGVGITIYGYLFWVAFILGAINILVVFWVGKPLKQLVYERQKCEANFRYHLSAVRNNKQSVSDSAAEKYEYLDSRKHFKEIILNFYSLMFRRAKIDIVNNLFMQVYSIIGTILALPRYFAKQINFGQMMQVNSAMMQMIFPMVYLSYMYESIAELRANMGRLSELKTSISGENSKRIFAINSAQNNFLEIRDFKLTDDTGNKQLLKDISFDLKTGKGIYISGLSGIGKSSMLRTIYGINDNFEGSISFKKTPKICLLPQKPYFPEDDFKRAVFYPLLSGIPSDDEFVGMLNNMGLAYLSEFINTNNDWRNLLSSGEQQKLNFCKVFIKHYDLLLLDEATSNTDSEFEEIIYDYIRNLGISYISVSHHERVKKYHDLVIDLAK